MRVHRDLAGSLGERVEDDVAIAREKLARRDVGLLDGLHGFDAPYLDAGGLARAGEELRGRHPVRGWGDTGRWNASDSVRVFRARVSGSVDGASWHRS